MKSSYSLILSCAVMVASIAPAQTSNSGHDPVPRSRAMQQKGFVDSTLGRINPNNVDYGQRIEDVRRIAFESTLESYDFWSNVAVMAVAVLLFLYVLYQARVRKKMTFSTAELLTSYHNQLAVAEEQLSDVSAKYVRLTAAVEREKEAMVAAKAAPARPQTVGSGNNKDVGRNASSTAEQQLRDDNAKLSQQLGGANETINSLRKQVSTLSRRLEEEQQKNRRLSGA